VRTQLIHPKVQNSTSTGRPTSAGAWPPVVFSHVELSIAGARTEAGTTQSKKIPASDDKSPILVIGSSRVKKIP
jgi:hypothetical protein